MATFKDAQAGWQIFKARNFVASKNEINEALLAQGLFPIADRTFRHYHKLKRYGYDRYVPINQLDIKTLKDPFWDKAVRGRYLSIPDASPVWITFPKLEVTLQGAATELSPSSMACRFTDSPARKFFQELKPPHERLGPILAYFPNSKTQFHATIDLITVPSSDQVVIVQFSFLTLAAVELMTERRAIDMTHLEFRIEPTYEHTAFGELSRKLYWLFQAMEASRLISDLLLAESPHANRYVVPSTRLKSLTMRSPAEGVLLAAIPAALVFLGLVTHITSKTKDGKPQNKERDLKSITAAEQQRLLSQANVVIRELETDGKPQENYHIPPRAIEIFEQQLVPSVTQLVDPATGKVNVTDPTAPLPSRLRKKGR